MCGRFAWAAEQRRNGETQPILFLFPFPGTLPLTPIHNAHILLPSFIIPLYEIRFIVR